MLSEVFLEAFADFYGSFTLDEIAQRLDLPVVELVAELDYHIDQNLDFIEEEMSYDDEEEGDEESED